MFIEKTLQSLKEVNSHGSRTTVSNEGYLYESTCKFNESVSENDIFHLLKTYRDLPSDYLKFLSLTNGCTLFQTLFTLEKMKFIKLMKSIS